MEAVRTEEPMRETGENDGIQRELELMRREKDLLERELQLTRHEIETAYQEVRQSPLHDRRNEEKSPKISEIKELIACFDGSSGTYEN